MIVISLMFLLNNFRNYLLTFHKVETPKGTVYTIKSKSTNELISYLKNKSGTVLVFPEGMMINFLTGMKSDGFYNSLLPLYIETFNEQTIIDHYTFNKPEYIILNNLDMRDYYFRFICQDYALGFCEFIQRNYTLDKTIDKDIRYMIFKLK